MIENLLTLARAEAGRMQVMSQPVDLNALLRQCWMVHVDRATARGLKVSWNIRDGITLNSDREMLRLLLHNLLDNAVSHADPNGRVVIVTSSRPDGVELSVANSGSRVAAADAEHVFDRLWRGDQSRTQTGLHCGLGLALCRQIVEALGGTIGAQTETGGEFVVTVRFGIDH